MDHRCLTYQRSTKGFFLAEAIVFHGPSGVGCRDVVSAGSGIPVCARKRSGLVGEGHLGPALAGQRPRAEGPPICAALASPIVMGVQSHFALTCAQGRLYSRDSELE